MPVLLNMFFVKDAAGRKPSYGERTILNAVEEANSVLLKDKTRGFSFPPAGKPVALNYGVSFGDPINCGAEFGDEIGRKLIDNLYADTLGFAKFRRDRGPPAVNVFFVWKLKFADLPPPDGVTMDYRTVLVCNWSERLGLALAHELGHVLLGTSPSLHNDVYGDFMNRNVMQSKGEVPDGLRSRMKAMYTKRAGGAPGWKWERKTPAAAPTPTPSVTPR